MKASWRKARDLMTQSSWGIQAEDNEASINALLERKCKYFWRLESIWGSKPSVQPPAASESLGDNEPNEHIQEASNYHQSYEQTEGR